MTENNGIQASHFRATFAKLFLGLKALLPLDSRHVETATVRVGAENANEAMV